MNNQNALRRLKRKLIWKKSWIPKNSKKSIVLLITVGHMKYFISFAIIRDQPLCLLKLKMALVSEDIHNHNGKIRKAFKDLNSKADLQCYLTLQMNNSLKAKNNLGLLKKVDPFLATFMTQLLNYTPMKLNKGFQV